jgi:hypothetical protein
MFGNLEFGVWERAVSQTTVLLKALAISLVTNLLKIIMEGK